MPQERTLLMEDARIMFRNFEGREGRYNREGDRNFCVLLDEETTEKLIEDNWNVKTLRPRDPDDLPQPYIQVSVGYKYKPPKVVLITSRGRTDIPEAQIALLDWVDIQTVDLIIRPYEWEVSGKTGVKAYLKTLFITIREDELELKYADVREIGTLDILEGEVVEEVRAIGR